MSENSSIQWTHHTFNPWWGCTKISSGCDHCYAATFASRHGVEWGKEAKRRPASEKYWFEPIKWNAKAVKEGKRQRVFCASMADVFENRNDLNAWRHRLFELIEMTPSLDWLLLTKRPEAVIELVPPSWRKTFPDNVWMGVTMENQTQADKRWAELIQIPCKIRFASVEPMLEPVSLNLQGISWVICGGESGNGFRPFNVDWARSIKDDCRKHDVAFFMKQLGGRYGGGEFENFPLDLQVRQFPFGSDR